MRAQSLPGLVQRARRERLALREVIGVLLAAPAPNLGVAEYAALRFE